MIPWRLSHYKSDRISNLFIKLPYFSEICQSSCEILFEVWDQGQKIGKSDAFMGLAIVSVSELLATASQRHVVPLQGRPYEEDKVGPCSPNTALYRLPYSLERDRRIIF